MKYRIERKKLKKKVKEKWIYRTNLNRGKEVYRRRPEIKVTVPKI